LFVLYFTISMVHAFKLSPAYHKNVSEEDYLEN
jgi:hypothetical protein